MKPRTAVLFCAALGVSLALLTLPSGFVIDDSYLVVHNRELQHLSHIPRFFTQAWGNDSGSADYTRINAAYYRPLTSTLLALEYAVFHLHPAGFHLISALLHGLCTGLCAALCLALLGPAGLLGGLLFAVHPVHTEALAAVTYQTTLLAATLAAATLWLTLRALRGGPRGALLVGLSTLLALLAKEEAASLPLLVLALVIFARPVKDAAARRQAALCVAAAGCATVLFLGVRAAIVRSSGITYFQGAPPQAVVFTMLRVLWLYAGLLVAPLHLCPFYDWFIVPIELVPSPQALAGAGLLGALLWAILRSARRWPQVALGLSWLLLGLLPVVQIVPILNVAAERFLYLPSLGWSLCCAAVVGRLAERFARAGRCRAAVYGAAGVLLCLYAARSATRLRDWRDDLALNQATARDFPQTPTPLINQAQIYLDRRDWQRAEAALEEALVRAPATLQGYLQGRLEKVRRQAAGGP